MTAALPQPNKESDWTVETLRQHTLTLVSEMDRRHTEALAAQLALVEATLGTHITMINAQADKVALALAASDKAVLKAENATEKRFEGVNEFRAQLTDQANTFMPRLEAEQRTAQNTEKIGAVNDRLIELTRRIDQDAGRGAGHADSTKNLVTIIGIVLAAITVLISIYLATGR
jgi:hypothetical protein